jgi:hypothetical protein
VNTVIDLTVRRSSLSVGIARPLGGRRETGDMTFNFLLFQLTTVP